jgi:hypothetical protein
VRDILVDRVDCSDLALMLRFEEVPYSRRRNAGLVTAKRTSWRTFCGEVDGIIPSVRLHRVFSKDVIRWGHLDFLRVIYKLG